MRKENELMRRNTLGDLLRKNARKFSDKTAVTCYAEGNSKVTRLSYQELNAAANRLVDGLHSIGLKEGDVVAVMCHNCLQFVVAAWGLVKANVVGTFINVNFVDHEIAYQINHSDAKVLFVEDCFIDLIIQIQRDIKRISKIGVIKLGNATKPDGWLDIEDFYSEKYSSEEPDVKINPDDVAIRVYTSGTTAFPKGIDLNHSNMEYVSRSYVGSNGGGQTVNSVFGYFIPLYHSGILHVFASTSLGSHVVIGSLSDMNGTIEIIEKEKVAVTVLPVTTFTRLINSALHKKLYSLEMAWWFGGAMPLEVLDRWFDAFPGIKVAAQWSQSECLVGTLSWFSKESGMPNAGNVIGKPYLDTEIKIVDENDSEVPQGEAGEIVMRSPAIMKGYYKNEEATREAFRNGWHHTGDVAFEGSDGYYYFVDRVKDMIKTGGVNVSAMEVEHVLNEMQEVEESAVFGVFHPDWTEAVVAAVVPRHKGISEEAVIKYCKSKVAKFKVPKKVLFVEKIPVNHVGKILRKELRETHKNLFIS